MKETLQESLYSSDTTISSVIRQRLLDQQQSFCSNDNISNCIYPFEKELLLIEVQNKVRDLLESLVIDTVNDPNTQETAYRVAKMFLNETLSGRFDPPPKITSFPNTKKLDELVVTKAEVKSLCSHHFQNIYGWAWVGILYGDDLLGLSKIHRIVDYFSRRPQIQEELVVQIADYIEAVAKPKGVGVVIKANHNCVKARGVEQDSFMVNSVLRGALLEAHLKSEFFELIKMSSNL